MHKKAMFQGHQFERIHLVKELGDIMWYVALACSVYDIDMDEVMEVNIEKLKERYPDGFDSELSQHRAEGDV
jgi:NTP pyrophosphatase (non-canonical NTP hydrolase)